jgi:hypothetical protein
MHLSRGGHQRPVTSTCVDGYRPRLTPRNLDMILAKGQSSADLILTETQEASRISVSPSPPSTKKGVAVVDHFPGWNRQATVQP